MVTKNIKDFKKSGEKYSVDIIGVLEAMPPEKMDTLIMATLRRRKIKNMTGKFIKVTPKQRRKR